MHGTISRPPETGAAATSGPLTIVRRLFGWTDGVLDRRDAIVGGALCLAAIVVSCLGLAQLSGRFNELQYGDLWFHADHAWVLDRMTHLDADHSRTVTHPVFSILSYSIAKPLVVIGLGAEKAAQALTLLSAAVATLAAYISMRALRLPALPAALFTGVFIASATFIFWFSLIETFPVAGASVFVMLAVIFWPAHKPLWVWVASSAVTLGITTTNWSLGLAGAFFQLGLKRCLMAAGAGLACVVMLAGVQKAVFPSSQLFFLPAGLVAETRHTQAGGEGESHRPWTPLTNAMVLGGYAAVTPPPERHWYHDTDFATGAGYPNRPLMSNQSVSPLKLGWQGGIAMLAWVALLGFGVWGAIRHAPARPAALAVGAYLAGQFALHSFYGSITFLYVAHAFPALVALAAFGWFTPARRLAMAAAAIFILAGGSANLSAFDAAVNLARETVDNCPSTSACPVLLERYGVTPSAASPGAASD